MSVDPGSLLKQLGSGVRPAGVGGPSAKQAAPAAEGAGFADLLRQAREGSLSSNLPVTIARSAGGAPAVKLSDDQLARLSLAADKAEAAGIRTALVLIDDQQVVLDVKDRSVTGPADLSAGVLGGIDGVITLTDRLKPAEVQPVVGPPGARSGLAASASLSRLLSGIEDSTKKAS